MRLIDTNIVSYFFNNHSLAVAYQPHLAGYELAISFQTLGELLEGGARAGWVMPGGRHSTRRSPR